jgi:hypothetical protein
MQSESILIMTLLAMIANLTREGSFLRHASI